MAPFLREAPQLSPHLRLCLSSGEAQSSALGRACMLCWKQCRENALEVK